MGAIEALIPPVVVCAAFVAVILGVRRFAEREAQREAQRERAADHGGSDDPGSPRD